MPPETVNSNAAAVAENANHRGLVARGPTRLFHTS
jgi:hypothetical protein